MFFSGEGSHSKARHRAFAGSTASKVLECTILIWRKSVESSSPKMTSSYQFSGFAGVCRRLRFFFLGFLWVILGASKQPYAKKRLEYFQAGIAC